MRINWNPYPDVLRITARYMFYEDFVGEVMVGRRGGNLNTDVNNANAILAKIFRPIWYATGGVPWSESQNLKFAVGNLVTQTAQCRDTGYDSIYEFDFEFTGWPTLGMFEFDMRNIGPNDRTFLENDILNDSLLLVGINAAARTVIADCGPAIADINRHTIRIVRSTLGDWTVEIDGVPVGAGNHVPLTLFRRIQFRNTTDAECLMSYYRTQ